MDILSPLYVYTVLCTLTHLRITVVPRLDFEINIRTVGPDGDDVVPPSESLDHLIVALHTSFLCVHRCWERCQNRDVNPAEYADELIP